MTEAQTSRKADAAGAAPSARAPFAGSSVPIAGLLAWLVPGLGHWYVGQRSRAVIFFVTISATFWTGVAVGGVRSTVHPTENGVWFAAQLCVGGESTIAWAAGTHVAHVYGNDVAHSAFWPSDNIAVVYSGIAGLLNLLIIIDALARADALSTQTAAATAYAARKRAG